MVTKHQDLTVQCNAMVIITQSDQSSVNLIEEIQFKFFRSAMKGKVVFGKGQYGAIYGSFEFYVQPMDIMALISTEMD